MRDFPPRFSIEDPGDLTTHHAVDKMEQMLGSYSAQPDPFVKNFEPEESPSGMIARSGTYNVRSRVVDDDGEVYAGASLRFTHRAAATNTVSRRLGVDVQAWQGMGVNENIPAGPRRSPARFYLATTCIISLAIDPFS